MEIDGVRKHEQYGNKKCFSCMELKGPVNVEGDAFVAATLRVSPWH